MDYKCDGNKDYLNSYKSYDCEDKSDESLISCCDGNHPAYNDYICEYKDYDWDNFGKESKIFKKGLIILVGFINGNPGITLKGA